MVKWLFRVINRVQKSEEVNENAILTAKHRVLQWAEAYVAKSEVIVSADARAMLRLLKWKDKPGLKVRQFSFLTLSKFHLSYFNFT